MNDLQTILKSSFAYYSNANCNDPNEIFAKEIDETLEQLIFLKLIKFDGNEKEKTNIKISATDLGKAVQKSHIDIIQVENTLADLDLSLAALNILSPFHVIYIITPNDITINVERTKIMSMVLFCYLQYFRLIILKFEIVVLKNRFSFK